MVVQGAGMRIVSMHGVYSGYTDTMGSVFHVELGERALGVVVGLMDAG
jgi:hypothetical protein